MKFYLELFVFIVLSLSLNAQERIITLKTDSSVIKIYSFDNGSKWSEEYFNGKNIVRSISYQDKDSTTISSERYWYSTLSIKKGITKAYSDDGTLKFIIDDDKGDLVYIDTLQYPNANILKAMKQKGDSIIKSIYGVSFFNTRVKWNIYDSYYFDKTYVNEPSFTIEWLRDETKNKYRATEFNIRYDVYYGDQRLEEAIQIIIDGNGNLLPSHLWNISWTIYNKGLEKLAPSIYDFKLSGMEAIELATKFGLQQNDSCKVWSELNWKSYEGVDTNIFNGRFVLSVFQELPPTKEKMKYGIRYIRHYRVWEFNPWTKVFLGAKAMDREIKVSH